VNDGAKGVSRIEFEGEKAFGKEQIGVGSFKFKRPNCGFK